MNLKLFLEKNNYSFMEFNPANFIKLKELAKNSIGISNDILETELESLLILHSQIEVEINKLENKIESIIKELNQQFYPLKELALFLVQESFLNLVIYLDLNQLMLALPLLVLNLVYYNLELNLTLVTWQTWFWSPKIFSYEYCKLCFHA